MGFGCQMYDGHTNYVRSICFLDGLLCSASEDHTIRVFDLVSGQHKKWLTGHTAGVWCVVEVYGKIWSGSFDTTIKVWDPKDGGACPRAPLPEISDAAVRCVTCSASYLSLCTSEATGMMPPTALE
jgi:WD40 repeat protein